ncbi:MAG: hypothetical protein IJC34_06640 [Lentisphaeria bacterium]|nr:hypothetical protein [Lentisphaeria bacterium]
MIQVTLFLTLAFICVLIAAFAAGGAEKSRIVPYWSLAGVVVSALAGGGVFFCKGAVKEVLLKKSPHLAFMADEIVIPWQVMSVMGIAVFFCGIILVLWGYNCRKNASKWYGALLWTLSLAFLSGHLLFLPQYYGIAAWINFFAAAKRDVFSPDISMLPAVCVMLLVNFLGGLLWLWHTLKTENRSWKNIFIFAGSFTGLVCILWLTAWGAGAWAKNAVDKKAAELAILPLKTAAEDPPELKSLIDPEFYTKHAKYNPPRSGKYDWQKDTVPDDEKEYTLKFFTSPELEKYLDSLKKSSAYIDRDVLYLSTLNHFRFLVRHRADIAELYFRTNQKEKVLPELLKYHELERLIPADTPFLICELVRTAARTIWVDALVKYGPEEKTSLPAYRKLLDWSKSWKVHLPCEAGFYLTIPAENNGALAAFFYTPYLNTFRYRGFFDAVNRIPALKNLEQQVVIPGDGMYANAAKNQRLGIVLGRTAIALKLYYAEHGKYPEKLSGLVPRYLSREYISPYTGRKFDYSASEQAHCRTLQTAHGPLYAMEIEHHFVLTSDQVTFSTK